MGTNHKIPVEFAKSIRRKIKVCVEQPAWRDFIQAENFKIYSRPSEGTVKTHVMVVTAITAVVLLIIIVLVKLLLHG